MQGFIFAQTLGGFIGAAIIYANYFHAIDIFEGGAGIRTMKTAGVFGAYAVSCFQPHFNQTLAHSLICRGPQIDYLTDVSAFFSEVLGTAILVLVIVALTDKKSTAPPPALFPLVIFLVILGISSSLGMQTGTYHIRPSPPLLVSFHSWFHPTPPHTPHPTLLLQPPHPSLRYSTSLHLRLHLHLHLHLHPTPPQLTLTALRLLPQPRARLRPASPLRRRRLPPHRLLLPAPVLAAHRHRRAAPRRPARGRAVRCVFVQAGGQPAFPGVSPNQLRFLATAGVLTESVLCRTTPGGKAGDASDSEADSSEAAV